jgi:hypothetical protein
MSELLFSKKERNYFIMSVVQKCSCFFELATNWYFSKKLLRKLGSVLNSNATQSLMEINKRRKKKKMGRGAWTA